MTTAMLSKLPNPLVRSGPPAQLTAWVISRPRVHVRAFSISSRDGRQPPTAVVAGAGAAGASAAMHLVKHGANVIVVDPRPPMTATTAYSTESYRDFFADPVVAGFMSRSVELLEELAGEDNAFRLNRRGYAFFSANPAAAEAFEQLALNAAAHGVGELRKHVASVEAYAPSSLDHFSRGGPTGFDLVVGSENIRRVFPWVSETAQVLLHARRCGWMDGQGLGLSMLERAKAGTDGRSAQVMRGSIVGFERSGSEVTAVSVVGPDQETIDIKCDIFINAAGAWAKQLQGLLTSEELPLENELHAKVMLNDEAGIIPQDAPMMIWRDAIRLDEDPDVAEFFQEMDDTADGGIVNSKSWLGSQPGGQHLRPAGNGRVIMLWEHLHKHIQIPEDPPMPVENFIDMYPQLCVTALKAMVPSLERYEEHLPRSTFIDGGYYTVTEDGRPLIGRHGAQNAFVCSGMGTYGLMGSPAAGELVALQALNKPLPSYSEPFEWPRKVAVERALDLLDDSN